MVNMRSSYYPCSVNWWIYWHWRCKLTSTQDADDKAGAANNLWEPNTLKMVSEYPPEVKNS
jgi:hypothetical protein